VPRGGNKSPLGRIHKKGGGWGGTHHGGIKIFGRAGKFRGGNKNPGCFFWWGAKNPPPGKKRDPLSRGGYYTPRGFFVERDLPNQLAFGREAGAKERCGAPPPGERGSVSHPREKHSTGGGKKENNPQRKKRGRPSKRGDLIIEDPPALRRGPGR